MRARGYLGWATVGVAWAVAAFALSAAPGCGSEPVSEARYETSPRDALKDSIQYSQAQHEKKPSKKARARR
ncbi:hypothetical protein [Paludisphaera soli]|uniref:hypothetical protein n=1 Tax=Paludisphaera soli TaxID=2712865 RepID=UPI0013E9DB9F|nr:hypothetical protein [Paludisphaera soli]